MRTKRRQEEPKKKNEEKGIRKYEVHRSLLISFPPPPPPRAACSRIPFIPHSLFLFFPFPLIMRLPVFARSSQENGKAPFLSHILFTRIKAPHEPNTETSIKTTKKRKKKIILSSLFFFSLSPLPILSAQFPILQSNAYSYYDRLRSYYSSQPQQQSQRVTCRANLTRLTNEIIDTHTHTETQAPNYTKVPKTKEAKTKRAKTEGKQCIYRLRFSDSCSSVIRNERPSSAFKSSAYLYLLLSTSSHFIEKGEGCFSSPILPFFGRKIYRFSQPVFFFLLFFFFTCTYSDKNISLQ